MRSKMRKFGWLVLGIALALVGTEAGRAQIGVEAGRAQDLLSLARQAIGGDAKIKEVKGLSLVGKIHTPNEDPNAVRDLKMHFFLADGPGAGDVLQLEGNAPELNGKGHQIIIRERQQISGGEIHVEGGEPADGPKMRKRIMIATDGMSGEPGKARIPAIFPDLMLGLLLKSPLPQEFSYAGDADNGRSDAITIKGPMGGTMGRLLLDKASHLPVELSYRGPNMIFFKRAMKPGSQEDVDVNKDTTFNIQVPPGELQDVVVRFSDHRLVDGVMLPHHITKVVNGQIAEEWEIGSYEINPKVDFKVLQHKED